VILFASILGQPAARIRRRSTKRSNHERDDDGRAEGGDEQKICHEHTDHDGASVFEEVCRMGLEGIVAKRIDLPYRSGRSKCWIKVRNPKAPASTRIEDGTL
jgi:ATP-dependent DNA ligase